MKAKFIRSDIDVGPNGFGEEFVLANSVEHPRGQKLAGVPIRRWKWGAILESPYAPIWCKSGIAIPDDDECREAVGLTPDELLELQIRYDKLKQDGSYSEELAADTQPEIINEEDDV